MSQINLMSGGVESNRPKGSFLSGSVFLSLIILVGVFGTYFGVLYYKKSLASTISSLVADEAEKKSLISGDKANRVADFADRLTVIKANLKDTALAPNDPFSRIERAMIPEVNLTAYVYDVEGKTIDIAIEADSFRAIAQQVVALKKDQVFSMVSVDGDAHIGTGGKIEAKFVLAL